VGLLYDEMYTKKKECDKCGEEMLAIKKICPNCGHNHYDVKPLNKKEDRNRKLIEMLDTGDYSLQDVADKFEISRQRVHEIYTRETGSDGFNVRRKKSRKKNAMKNYLERFEFAFYCKGCGRAVRKGWTKARHYNATRTKYCPWCHAITKKKRDPRITFTCAYCAKEFHPFYNWMSTEGYPRFCSRECYGKAKEKGLEDNYEVLPVFKKLID
jgi:Zn finger protein HypA/HybF involved in hydrogenase expression